MRSALRDAGVPAETIGYVEAHGTGTALGDPVEISGLTSAFDDAAAGGPARQSCAIGSVKTNIGHLESAAGLAGLTKVLLQMRHGTLVPSLHADRDNPRIDFGSTPFRLQREVAHWPRNPGNSPDEPEMPRRAGISSFGAGGANAHIVVEEYMGPQVPRGESAGAQVAVVSARDADQLRQHCGNLAEAMRGRGDELRLDEVTYQLQVRREPLAERVAFVVTDVEELV